jgi:outer membrane protein assembly factor BamB
MTSHLCYRFSATRHRDRQVKLEPSFSEPMLTMGVGYLPVLAEDMIILSFTAGRIAAFNRDDLRELWSFQMNSGYEAAISSPGSVLFNGNDLVVSGRDQLMVLHPRTGQLREQAAITEINIHNASPVPDGVIAAYREGDAYGIGFFQSAKPSTPVWTVRAALPLGAISTLGEVCCFAPTLDELVAVKAQDGTGLWKTSVAELGTFEDDLGRKRKGEIASEPILWNDLVIVGVRGNRVIALEVQSGKVRWNCNVDALVPSNLTLDADGVLHLLSPVRYYRIQAASGEILTSFDVEDELAAVPAFPLSHLDTSATHIYCAGLSGTVFAMSQSTGKVVWKHDSEAGAPFSHYPLVDDDCLYFLDGQNTLLTFPRK